MFIFMPAISFSKEKSDSISVLDKIWSYKRNFAHHLDGENNNMYLRYTLNTERRNPTLFLVPSLYSFARGDRLYISEIYGKMEQKENHEFTIKPQIVSNTIPHGQISEAFTDYLTPTLYEATIYEDGILSPFCRSNRRYYRYEVHEDGTNLARVTFRPKLKNTQLVKGYAVVETNTGRIVYTIYDGEFDMLKFHIDVVMGTEDTNSLLPQRCKSDLNFNFIGNRISTHFLATYNNPVTLPDSLHGKYDRARMDELRPIQLREEEDSIYQRYDKMREEALKAQEEKEKTDSLEKKGRSFGDKLWDIGDYLVTSSSADAGAISFSLSPILNPQYVSYSQSRGLSYKIQLGARYSWNKKRYLTIQPQIGYNFKIKQFFHYTPIRMTYNPKRNGYAELVIANGNRISNASILQVIKDQYGADVMGNENMDLDYFTDNYIQAVNNVVAYDWLEIKAGIVYHIRRPVNVSGMIEFNQPTVYKSFAPTLTLHVSPWRRGPYFTLNYERSIDGILDSNLEYERIEMDVSHKFRLNAMRVFCLTGGFGLYTNSKTTYFLDYANFRDQNLPGGWEDDWTGNFQLIDPQWYNMSKYYLRVNSSYESPLLFFSFLPWIGKQVEKERIYLSTLSIEHTRAYSEIGYGISTRFVSIGAFASFLNIKFQNFGFKFTFELFRKW